MNRTILILASLVIGSLCYSGEVGPTLSVHVVEERPSTGSRFVDTPEHPKLGYIRRDPAIRITALKQAMAKPVPWKTTDRKNNVLASGMSYQVQLVLIESDIVALYGLQDNGKFIALTLGERIVAISQEIHDGPFEISVRNEQEMLEIAKELKPLCAEAESFPEQSAEKCLHQILGTKSVVKDTAFGGRLTMIDVPYELRGEIRAQEAKLLHTLETRGTREAVRVLATFLDDDRYIYEPGCDYGSHTIAQHVAASLGAILRRRPELPGATSAFVHDGLRKWWTANKAAYESSTPTPPTPK